MTFSRKVMEKELKEALNTPTLERTGYSASGCINDGSGYKTNTMEIFVKRNNTEEARIMFNSEYESLRAIELTDTIRVPHPIKVVQGQDGWVYNVLEFLNISTLNEFQRKLGQELAHLHLHNEELAKKGLSDQPYISKFGFHMNTCVGRIPVDNTWQEDWVAFFCETRIEPHVRRIISERGDKNIATIWTQLKPIMPRFFENIEVKPSLLHGDLWFGNAGQTAEEPVIFDPGCVFGHHEFDIAATSMHGGGFNKHFYEAYHKLIPKAPGFEIRQKLYQLFHLLNHWNHFGSGYKESSLRVMKSLLNTSFPLNH